MNDHDLIEAAYWEMQARVDLTQPQYPNVGEHEAFRLAIQNLLNKRDSSPLETFGRAMGNITGYQNCDD